MISWVRSITTSTLLCCCCFSYFNLLFPVTSAFSPVPQPPTPALRRSLNGPLYDTTPPGKISSSSSSSSSITTDAVTDVESATTLLTEWDASYNSEQQQSSLQDDEVARRYPQLRAAVLLLNEAARDERTADSTTGRVMLGICASNATQGLATLKTWVTRLTLPRGLLHGMDKDGVPLQLDGAVYIKYNSGGVYTFADIRKSGLGFDALWKPGDALLELYDGNVRGVYFQPELADGLLRQYLVPLELFDNDDNDDQQRGQQE